MKRIIVALVFLLSTTATHAAGPFDGIYSYNFGGTIAGFASIHEKNGVMIAITLDPSPFESGWEAISGIRNGNNVRLSSIFGTVNVEVDITFNGDNSTGSATVISCSDKDDNPSNDSENCDLPAGTVLNLNKIF
ncbi:MAG: hypothetical protein H6937_09430 [Burkholderiales bacterium]|nr:hypothetical protein [Burkholderiales bacterium]MDR4517483.1 hypothetical protein [Nitrosomonas sp.]